MNKIFKPIKEFDGYYISEDGQIIGFRKYGKITKEGKTIKPEVARNGYLVTRLWKDNKPNRRGVHRLLAQTFISNPENKPQVNHKNGNKTDNRLENLEWCTCSENNKHASVVLGHRVGTKNINCKLLPGDIPKIRLMLEDRVPQRKIAEYYGVTKNTIACIKKGITWMHIKKH